MITLRTITTIELSSKCNLKCRYCIHRLMEKNSDRTPMIMESETFKLCLKYLGILCLQGTQKEVNLNGNGESTLDPKLIKRIEAVKNIVGDRPVNFCTNGITMDLDLALQLKDVGIQTVHISPHSPFHARRAAYLLSDLGIPVLVNTGSITDSHNWAGQLEPENSINCRINIPCAPLMEGRGYVLAEGNVTPCCYDYRNLGVFGTVYDDYLLKREIKPYELCKTCHQVIPKYILEREESRNGKSKIYKK